MFPMPSNVGELLGSFKKVIVPELNMGQLRMMLRSEFLVDCIGINKVQGKPFSVTELVEHISEHLSLSDSKAAKLQSKTKTQSKAG
jgi:2-oxoglutarate ferredoxin oxidoreductase subunit alpha